jgi:maleate isomerase
MCQGHGYHREIESALKTACSGTSPHTQILTSAGALVDGLKALGAKKIAIITPYMRALTTLVVDYIESEGIEVLDAMSLEVPDNLAVGRLDPMTLIDTVQHLSLANVDAVVLSACVQMPSLPALGPVQQSLDMPVLSTAAATVFQILRSLNIPASVPDAGDLLSGRYH